MRILAFLAPMIAAAGKAQALKTQEVSRILEVLSTEDEALDTANENLGGMLVGKDQLTIGAYRKNIDMFRAGDFSMFAVGYILVGMIDPKEREPALHRLKIVSIGVLQAADSDIKYSNGVLTIIESKAGVTEAMRARDSMVAIREQLRLLQHVID